MYKCLSPKAKKTQMYSKKNMTKKHLLKIKYKQCDSFFFLLWESLNSGVWFFYDGVSAQMVPVLTSFEYQVACQNLCNEIFSYFKYLLCINNHVSQTYPLSDRQLENLQAVFGRGVKKRNWRRLAGNPAGFVNTLAGEFWVPLGMV